MSESTNPQDTAAEWTPQPGESIRAKWTMDGATTLAEAADRLEAFAADLRRLHGQGWTLTESISDDYGFLVSPDGDAGNFGEDEDLDGDEADAADTHVPPSAN